MFLGLKSVNITTTAALEARLSEHENKTPEATKPTMIVEEDEPNNDMEFMSQPLPNLSPGISADFSNVSAWFAPIIDTSLLPPPADPMECVDISPSALSFEPTSIKDHLSPLVCSDL